MGSTLVTSVADVYMYTISTTIYVVERNCCSFFVLLIACFHCLQRGCNTEVTEDA